MQTIYTTTGSLKTFMTNPVETMFNIIFPKDANVDLEAVKAALHSEFKKENSVIVPVGHIEDELNHIIQENAEKIIKVLAAEIEHNNTQVFTEENVIHIHCSAKIYTAKDVTKDDLASCLFDIASDSTPLIENSKEFKTITDTIKGFNIPLESVDFWLYPSI